MGVIHFQPSRLNGLGAPEVVEETPEATATFALGAPVQRNAGTPSEFEEAPGGATVTGIVGVALNAVAAGVPDLGDKFQLAKAAENIMFLGQVYDVSGSAVATVAGDGTYLGNSYGIVKVGTSWYVDEEDVTNVVVEVVKEIPEWNAVLFKWIDSAIAE